MGRKLVEGYIVKSFSPDVSAIILCSYLENGTCFIIHLFLQPVFGEEQVTKYSPLQFSAFNLHYWCCCQTCAVVFFYCCRRFDQAHLVDDASVGSHFSLEHVFCCFNLRISRRRRDTALVNAASTDKGARQIS